MTNKINILIKKLSEHNIDFFLVPNSDQFLNEYLPNSEKRIEFLTSFDGSNAFLVLSKKQSYFFTDSRYLIAAKKQIDNNIFQIIDLSNQNITEFLINIAKDNLITFDPKLHSAIFIKNLLDKKLNLTSIYNFFKKNPIDEIWQNKEIIKKEIFLHKKEFTGEDSKNKINKIYQNLNVNSDAIFISSAESCSYLFNLRSFVIEFVPICLSFAIISKNQEILLFLDKKNLTKEAKISLKKIEITNFSNFREKISNFCHKNQIQQLQLDLNYCNYKILDILQQQNINIINEDDPTLLMKAIKNKIEIAGMKKAHKKDGIALTKFLYWLKNHPDKIKISEITASEKLLEFRSKDPDFICPSFNVISGFAENSAIIHYKANSKSNKYFDKNSLYLVDSGGQYNFGTTDVTRTIAIGNPSDEQKKNFTLVLKGHIALARSKFPIGTTGNQLDILARQYLWQDGKNYGHGTGHGVGYFLNVHEGPCSISPKSNKIALKEGMIISNEPGFYLENQYGIRIENLILIKKSNQKDFLEFETITLAPIDHNLIDFNLLNYDEKKWLKNYHQKIYNELKDDLDDKYFIID